MSRLSHSIAVAQLHLALRAGIDGAADEILTPNSLT